MSTRRSRKGCIWYAVGIFIGLPLLLIILFAILLFARENAARNRLKDQISKLQAQDLPIDSVTLQKYHESLTSTEFTNAWLTVLEELTGERFDPRTSDLVKGVPLFDGNATDEVPGPGEPWGNQQAIRSFVASTQPLHKTILDLGKQQLNEGTLPVRFPVQWDGIDTLLTSAQNLRQAARLLQVHCQVANYDGNSSAVAENILGLFGCSRVLEGDPILISQLVANAISGMALAELQVAVENDTLDAADLKTILEILTARLDISSRWQTAWIGERALYLPSFQNGKAIGGQGISLPLRSRDALAYLEHIQKLMDIETGDDDKFIQEIRIVEGQLQGLGSGNPLQIFDTMLTSMAAPAASALGDAFLRKAVHNRLATLACSIRLYQEAEGKFPKSLADLDTRQLIEIDRQLSSLTPPGGKPFGYQLAADGGLATIWGFDVSQLNSTPSEPPDSNPAGMIDDTASPWVWKLGQSRPDAATPAEANSP